VPVDDRDSIGVAKDLSSVTTLLCDADGNLFDSERPAFEASVRVTNRFLSAIGSQRQYAAETLRRESLGRNFRRLATDLADDAGVDLSAQQLTSWVAEENDAVTRHLAEVLCPDPAVTAALGGLARRYRLAVVTSSALRRLDACLEVTGLATWFPEWSRFSAQDSLPAPTSKPDPAVYLLALEVLGLRPDQALAVEDAEAGVAAAVAAGIPTIGNLVHVPGSEQASRRSALLSLGAAVVVEDWSGLVDLLGPVGAGAGGRP
jgi:beta-phosphoglucomutase-like phosphatase (HAD superfamily)